MGFATADFSRRSGGGFALGDCDFRPPSYDPDSLSFFKRALVTDTAAKRRHDLTVKALKAIPGVVSPTLWGDLDFWVGADAGSLREISSGVVGQASDGEAVRDWVNRKSAAALASQPVALQQPVYRAATGPGGQAAIFADGVNHAMPLNLPVARSAMTLIALGTDMLGSGSTGVLPIVGRGAASGPVFGGVRAGGTQGYRVQWSGAGGSGAVVHGNLATMSGPRCVAYSLDGARATTYVAGLGSSNTVFTTSPVSAFQLFGDGAQRGIGHYSHFMLYAAALSVPQIDAVQGLLTTIYGGDL